MRSDQLAKARSEGAAAMRRKFQEAGAEFCACGHLNIDHYGAADWQVNPNCDYFCGAEGCGCKKFSAALSLEMPDTEKK